MSNKATVLVGLLAAVGLVGAAPPNDDDTPRDQAGNTSNAPSKQDTDFFNNAMESGLLEVRLAQIALQKSTNDEVRKFAQRMIDEHGKLNTQLTQIAQGRHGLTVPTDLTSKNRKEVDDLNKETGAKFDRDYMSKMVDDHQSDAKAFEKEAKDGTDAQIKAAASQALPTIHAHLEQAKQIHERLKK